MSELEKARAGFVVSLLLFALGLVLLEREPSRVSGTAESVAVCAATKGALCAPADDASVAHRSHAGSSQLTQLGAITVVASRLPAHVGEMLVQAPRFATELDGRLRVAVARGAAETEIIVAQ
ncbi:MAG TPA: hypothetical protein VH542_08370 [Steroidobacteraceae bacterium]|jgi:hypothetical protein